MYFRRSVWQSKQSDYVSLEQDQVVFQHEGLALVKLNVIVRSSFVVAMELPQTVFNKLVKQVGFTIITVYDDGVRVGFAGLHYARSLLQRRVSVKAQRMLLLN